MNIETYISSVIQKQFPSLYQEDGKMLVELVKSYYEFLETQNDQYLFNNRRLYSYRDINQTLPEFISFFRNKYLDSMPSSVVNDRFTIKRILDLYRRKGTKEGIELFFKLFYDETVNIFYPSEFILKASDSTWVRDRYLEVDTNNLDLIQTVSDQIIHGSVSLATAYVDQVFFYTHNNKIYPILFISDNRGSFVVNETIMSGTNTYGSVRGSLSDVTNIKDIVGTSSVGDVVDIISPSGVLGKARVTKLKQSTLGVLSETQSTGYGYSESAEVYISTQLLRISNDTGIKRSSIITQGSSQGIVLGTKNILGSLYVGIYSEDIFDIGNVTINGILFPVSFVTDRNDTVIFDKAYTPTTEVAIRYNNDLLSGIPNIPAADLNSSHVSGSITQGLNTPLNIAFSTDTIPLSVLNVPILEPGFDYPLDQFLFAYDDEVSPDSLPETIIKMTDTSSISLGSIVYQNSGARAYVLSKDSQSITLAPISTIPFLPGGIFLNGVFFNSMDVSYNPLDSRNLGSNLVDILETTSIESPIDKIELLSSGYFYSNNSPVSIEIDGLQIASGLSKLDSVGISEGRWRTTNSHINKTNRIHDGSYYQQFSYVLTSDVPRENYLENLKAIIHPVGTTVFSKRIVSNSEIGDLRITASTNF